MVTKAKNSTLEATLSVVNVGTGMDVLVNEAPSQQSVFAKSIKAGTNVTITDDGSTLTINSTASGGTGGITGATNAGTGAGVASGVSGTSLVLKSLKAGPNISITSTADEITVEATGSASGEANTASNVGTGVGVFKSKTGVNLALKTLKAGANITLTPSTDEILIDASGSGGSTPFADISAYGAVGDFVPAAGGLGSGTANDTAVMAAIATNKPIYIPDGNFYVANWATRLAYSRASVHGSSIGHVWGDTGRGKQILGKSLFVGSTNTHEISYAGGIFWAPNGGYNGIRQWTGHHNWMVLQPDAGPMQFQLYPGGKGQAITASCESPNKLNAVYGTFDTALLRAGMHVGWNGAVYKIVSVVSAAQITVTTFAGASPAFVTSSTQRPFYCYYEYSKFVGNTSGTSVTRFSGDALPYGVTSDHMFCIVNGIKYDVTQGPESTGSPHVLTLSASPGTLTGATCEFFRCYGPWAYVTLFRLQGVAGGTETNGGMALNIKNELRIWNGGTHAELFGPIKINAAKTAIGPGDGADTTGERFEVEADGVWLGSSSANAALINGVKVFGGGIGFIPVIAARGAESDKGLGFDLPGTGKFGFTYNTYGKVAFEVYCPGSTDSWGTLTPGVGKATFSVNSALSNVDLVLAPKGTGTLQPKGIPACILYKNASQALTNGSYVDISWDAEDYDPYGMHNTSVFAERITVPVAGIYRCTVNCAMNITFSASGNAFVSGVAVFKNGVAWANGPLPFQYTVTSTVTSSGATLSCDIPCAAGDVIKFGALVSAGGITYCSTTALSGGSRYVSASVTLITAT